MSFDDSFQDARKEPDTLSITPPFIWPEARFHAGLAQYADMPPTRQLFTDAELISGLLVGAADRTIQWLEERLQMEGKRRIWLVLVLFPAGPTRESHLQAIHQLQASFVKGDKALEVRLLPIARYVDGDCEQPALPPTVIQAHNTRTGRTAMSIGSVGDVGHDPVVPGSLNVVLHPDDALRDAWRRWFQYIFSSATPLTEDTIQIPHLVPAKGDPEAALLWEKFELICQVEKFAVHGRAAVDPETGEVKAGADGKEVVPWDEGTTALDPIARAFQPVYANGWLVTVDEATRIKPLTIPVKAALLGQQSERNVGALKQRQSFTLKVLDVDVDKAIEKCRKVTDVMELLTYQLSPGNRWLPVAAKDLLEKELESRNAQGQEALRAALGGNDITQFIAKRTSSIRKDLNEMYRQLGQGDTVPNEKLQAVLDEIKQRLEQALETRITPRAVYNRIAAPDLTATAPDENWGQPLSLLARSARIFRESLTDPFFPRRFVGLSFSMDDFRKACNVFGDVIVTSQDANRAKHELSAVEEILDTKKSTKEKCQEVWRLIRGGQPELRS